MSKNIEILKEAISKIELTNTQRERAVELYENICKTIEEITELKISFYPQGSFATKTVVRPYENGEERLYDVDVICEVNNLPKNISPKKLMDIFENALKKSRYSKKFKKWEKCFTVKYAERDDDEFSIDIIPSIPASIEKIQEIKTETERTELVDSSIEIPDVSATKSTWISNNPEGYISWFDQKMDKFEKNFIELENTETLTAAIDELPDDHSTNMLRNVIKILKRLRDVYFFRSKSTNKPASIVITTIVAKLANKINHVNNEYDLLKAVILELEELEKFDEISNSSVNHRADYVVFEVIKYYEGEWILKNPANGLDNILSSWNEEQRVSKDFFAWIKDLSRIINELERSSVEESRKSTEFYNSMNLAYTENLHVDFKVEEEKSRPWGNDVNDQIR